MNSFGDIHATNLEEATIASLAMVVGFLAFGISMSDMSSVIGNMMAQRGRFYNRMEAVHHYMVCNKKILDFHLSFLLVILSLFSPFNQRHMELPEKIQTWVHDYYYDLWYHHRGRVIQGLLDDLPFVLRTDVSSWCHKSLIKKVSN